MIAIRVNHKLTRSRLHTKGDRKQYTTKFMEQFTFGVIKTETELFCYSNDKSVHINPHATFAVTKEEKVVSNKSTDTDFISPCNHK